MGRGTETCDGCIDGCPAEANCRATELPEHPATVSSFVLDKYEATVGRFRAFVEAGGGTQLAPPREGSGSHPLIAGSGWDSAWNEMLAADEADLIASLNSSGSSQTWTDTVGANEPYPMNYVDWYEAFAFCIWDGGRLPTEAEWEYAAAGGNENRVFPWGNDVVEPAPANYADTDDSQFVAVGNHPAGNGRWGHADLAGSLFEWVFDWWAADWYTATESGCSNCANVTAEAFHIVRSAPWGGTTDSLRVAYRGYNPNPVNLPRIGWRCARDAE